MRACLRVNCASDPEPRPTRRCSGVATVSAFLAVGISADLQTHGKFKLRIYHATSLPFPGIDDAYPGVRKILRVARQYSPVVFESGRSNDAIND